MANIFDFIPNMFEKRKTFNGIPTNNYMILSAINEVVTYISNISTIIRSNALNWRQGLVFLDKPSGNELIKSWATLLGLQNYGLK